MQKIMFALLVLFSSPVSAWESPERAISEFMNFELNGGRLSSKSWALYASKYAHVPNDYDEPGWDVVTVVSKYEIGQMKCSSSTSCAVSVTFTLYPTSGFTAANVVDHKRGGTEKRSYKLESRNDEWRINPRAETPLILNDTYLELTMRNDH